MRSTRSVPLAVASESSFRRIVRRNLSAILGLALLSFAAAVAASLATWTVDDPSLSHATDHAARNVLGIVGAVIADLFMQFLGLTTIVVLLPPVTWAWRLVFGKRSGFGTFNDGSGNWYSGPFADGVPNGTGRCFAKQLGREWKCSFKSGRLTAFPSGGKTNP